MARKPTSAAMSEKTQYYAAVPQGPKVRPAFTVQKLQGTVPHRVHVFDKETNRIKSKVVMEDAGYMVKFMKGHSIRCRDIAHLRQIGADMKLIPMVDEEGEVQGAVPNIDLRIDEDDDELEVIDKE